MPLAPPSFQPPHGPLRSSLFPGDDLGAFLDVWIADAETRATAAGVATDGDEARAWVLYRAYDIKCQDVPSGTETTGRVVDEVAVENEGSVKYANLSAVAASNPDFCALAARYLARAAPIGADSGAGSAPRRRSVVVNRTVTW